MLPDASPLMRTTRAHAHLVSSDCTIGEAQVAEELEASCLCALRHGRHKEVAATRHTLRVVAAAPPADQQAILQNILKALFVEQQKTVDPRQMDAIMSMDNKQIMACVLFQKQAGKMAIPKCS